jgi:DNA-binding NtrC family response regulator
VIERALILSRGPTLSLEVIRLGGGDRPGRPPGDRLEQVERTHILAVLERCGWRIDGHGHAAERLGLRPSTLRSRMQKLGIARPGVPGREASAG